MRTEKTMDPGIRAWGGTGSSCVDLRRASIGIDPIWLHCLCIYVEKNNNDNIFGSYHLPSKRFVSVQKTRANFRDTNKKRVVGACLCQKEK